MRSLHLLLFVTTLASSSCAVSPVNVTGLKAARASDADVEAIRLLVANPPNGIEKGYWGTLKSIHFTCADEARLSLDGDDGLEVRAVVLKRKGQWKVAKSSISYQAWLTG